MTTRTDAQHAYFARVPDRLLADLRSAQGPVLTFVEAEGQLQLNRAAVDAIARQAGPASNLPVPLVDPPILFVGVGRPEDARRSEEPAR